MRAGTDDGDAARIPGWHVPELARAGQAPPLTAEEEAGLAARIAAGRRAEERLAEGDPPAGLARTAQDGAKAGDLLVEANLGLVVAIARRYLGRGVPFPALVQAGNAGLVRALEKYDHAKGYRFSTYATWWIRQAITRRLAEGLPRVPVQALNPAPPDQAPPDREPPAGVTDALTRTEQRMLQDLGREPTPEELAAELDLPV